MKRRNKVAVVVVVSLLLTLTVGLAWAAGVTGQVIGVNSGDYVVDSNGDVHWAGVIVLDIDGQWAGTFCTDLHHPIGLDPVVATNQKVDCRTNWLVHNYPPQIGSLTNHEAAARQAAVWHFSDNFSPSRFDPIGVRAWEIIDEVNALTDNGTNPGKACDALWAGPVDLEITPSNATLSAGESVQFTVTATQGDTPLTGLSVDLSSSFGSLSTVQVTTNADGQATFTVSSATAGNASVAAHARYALPTGTIFQGVDAERQKLVLGQVTNGNVFAEANANWQNAGSVTVHLFHDRNMDGQQGDIDLETNLFSWQVTLTDGSGQVVGTGLSDASGNVSFTDLPNGDYTATYTLLSNWITTTPTEVSVTVNNDSHEILFGAVQAPLVIAYQYHDLNGNGQKDDGEPFLPGWDMALYRENGDFVLGANGTTDEDGQAVLTFLRHSEFVAGMYQVKVDMTGHDNWVATTPTEQAVALVDGTQAEVYFGVQYTAPAGSITVVKDANQQASFGFTGDLGAFTLTTGGSQQFSNLPPGSYTIAEDPTSFGDDYWALLSVQCVDQNNQAVSIVVDWANFSAEVPVVARQNLTCTYLNQLANLTSEHEYKLYLPLVTQ
ncbi:SdrD B-like domain-containing protein [Anaerolineales bacterium HSG25]|nr:SdrD B-like domain-containing protein [Anaerolineales bacterium HSG25]